MNRKKNVSIVLNGQMPDDHVLVNQIIDSGFIIAVDGSANKLIDLGIIPDVIIAVSYTHLTLPTICSV